MHVENEAESVDIINNHGIYMFMYSTRTHTTSPQKIQHSQCTFDLRSQDHVNQDLDLMNGH